jgi:hypothetical protein
MKKIREVWRYTSDGFSGISTELRPLCSLFVDKPVPMFFL